MSESDTLSVTSAADESSVQSRRKFLKVSMAAGAAVAAVAAGVHFMPSLESAVKSKSLAAKAASGEVLGVFAPSTSSSEAMILVIEGESISVYKGEDKYVSKDPSFARQITSSIKERL
jgi:secreted PhoX family phosphatase